MDDPFNYPETEPTAAPTPGIMEEWNQALGNPNVRASLLSFGLSLMQPPGFGQTGAGQVAQAIGSAGATVGAREKMEREDTEAESKQMLRASQAEAATARSHTAAANSETARLRLENQARDTDSKVQLRAAQAATSLARVRQLEMRSMQLEAQIAAFPEDQELKRQLNEAKVQLAQEQALLSAARTDTETGRSGREERRLDIQAGEATSRSNLRGARADSIRAGGDGKTGNLDIAREKVNLSKIFQSQRRHRDAMALYNKYTQSLPYGTKPPDSATWMRNNGFGDVANGPLGGAAAAPAPAATPAPTTPATPPEDPEATRAYNAIKQGASSELVRKRYKERTGKDLP